jgi:hypothetical protein
MNYSPANNVNFIMPVGMEVVEEVVHVRYLDEYDQPRTLPFSLPTAAQVNEGAKRSRRGRSEIPNNFILFKNLFMKALREEAGGFRTNSNIITGIAGQIWRNSNYSDKQVFKQLSERAKSLREMENRASFSYPRIATSCPIVCPYCHGHGVMPENIEEKEVIYVQYLDEYDQLRALTLSLPTAAQVNEGAKRSRRGRSEIPNKFILFKNLFMKTLREANGVRTNPNIITKIASQVWRNFNYSNQQVFKQLSERAKSLREMENRASFPYPRIATSRDIICPCCHGHGVISDIEESIGPGLYA